MKSAYGQPLYGNVKTKYATKKPQLIAAYDSANLRDSLHVPEVNGGPAQIPVNMFWIEPAIVSNDPPGWMR